MITDEFFISELDGALKKRGIKKAERNKYISAMLLCGLDKRDELLNDEDRLTAEYLAKKAEEKLVPTEHSEQVNLIHWFKCTYPGVRIAAIPNGGNRNEREAAALVLEGVSPGIPDIFIPEWLCWVEMKRVKCGVFSKEQEGWRDYIQSIGQHYILAYGFEDAKKQLAKFKSFDL